MSIHDIFPHFLETVQAFGLRTKDSDNTWSNFHFRKLIPEEGHRKSPVVPDDWHINHNKVLEICYTVRFFEPNYRDIGDP